MLNSFFQSNVLEADSIKKNVSTFKTSLTLKDWLNQWHEFTAEICLNGQWQTGGVFGKPFCGFVQLRLVAQKLHPCEHVLDYNGYNRL